MKLHLYIGNISVNHGAKHERYLYTDKEVNEKTLNKIRDILNIDYKKLLPNQPGQILVNNFNADMSNGNWENAYDIAVQRYSKAKVEKSECADKSLYYAATVKLPNKRSDITIFVDLNAGPERQTGISAISVDYSSEWLNKEARQGLIEI